MSEMSRTPQESAEHLSRSLDNFTVALGQVKRRFRYVFGLIAIVVLAIGLSVKFNYDGEVRRCNAGNELRSEENAKWDGIVAFLEANGTGDTPEEQAFLEILDENLVLRDCSDVNWLGR